MAHPGAQVTVLAGTTDAGFADGQFTAKTQQNTSLLSFPQVRGPSKTHASPTA